ncbi:MAG: penicillin-binding protein 2, partial [Candidatus Cloacimonadota bacterium]|nr:penicillin-binding protein 2 [Candidatus Cloacimonadota bacterium]
MSKKFLVFLGLHAILLVFWIAHLVAIQLIDIYRFDKQSVVKQRYKNRKRILQSIRGDIYDARNNLLVSTNKYYRLEINRTAINDNLPEGKTKKSFYNEIAEFFDKNTHISKESILTKFSYSKNKVDYIYISKKMTIDELLKIQKFFKEKDISCLTYNFSHMNRIYTQNNIANRLLGSTYSQFDPHKNMFNQIYKLKGLTGIEKSYDEYLLGKYGWLEGRLDGSGDFIQMPDSREKEAVNGNSIQLTIDKNIQEIVERHLAAGLTKFEAQNGVAVVIEPSTGKILALSSINKDDAGKQEREIRLSSNLGVSFLFEPGSTFKSLPILLALEDNLYDWTTKIDCSTLVTEYDRKISDHKRFDEFNLKNLLTYSSNPGISRVVEKVGKYRYWSFLKDVGFGRGSGLDLKGENSGKLRHHTRWSAYSLHSLAFGQEISVNIVQLAKVYAAIANGGKMMRPYLLEKVISPKGEIVEHFKPKFEKTIGSKASIDTLKSYLKNVVDNGTATIAQFNGISCAGKTGTAEKTISKNDDETTYYTSFAGFLPVENPK